MTSIVFPFAKLREIFLKNKHYYAKQEISCRVMIGNFVNINAKVIQEKLPETTA